MAQEIADSKLLDTWGSSGTKIEPDISKIIEGWQLGEQPPHEYMNWLQNTFGSKLNHILKNGVASWNNETEYLAGSSVQHNGSIWLSKTTNTNSEPTGLNANWEKVAISKDLTVTVDTLADLKNISYPANTVWASGYHTKNDGAFGSHIFRLKGVKTTETDNSGTIIIATIGGTDYVYELQYDGAVNVRWFGAVGDGVTDDTVAIQKAIDSISSNSLNNRLIVYSHLITDTIHIGRWVLSGNDVLGYSGNSVRLYSKLNRNNVLPTFAWGGTAQLGTTYTVKTDSVGTYNLRDNDKPMISVVGASAVGFENIALDGRNLAYSGIRVEGNTAFHTFDTVLIDNVKVGVELGLTYDLTAGLGSYYGYSDSPYHKANVYNAPAVGGNQIDRCSFKSCSFNGSKAGFLHGSAQALLNNYSACEFWSTTNGFGLAIAGGRLALSACGFNKDSGSPTADIWFITGTNQISINQMHSESTATYNILGQTSGNDVPMVDVNGADKLAMSFPAGGGQISVSNSKNVSLTKGSDNNIDFVCNIESSKIVSPFIVNNNGAYKTNALLMLTNCLPYNNGSILSNGNGAKSAIELTNGTITTSADDILTLNGRVNIYRGGNQIVAPTNDNLQRLGTASFRWQTIYAGTGTINTSDAREKTFSDIPEVETLVAKELKTLMRRFKFNDAIETKGEDRARIHFGTSAQEVIVTFEKYGLDAMQYAIVCYDEWEAEYETKVIEEAELDEECNTIKEAVTEEVLVREAGNRYGIRYEELLCFIMSAL